MSEKETTLAEIPRVQAGAEDRVAPRGAALSIAVAIAQLLGTYAAFAGGLLLAEARINQALAALARVSPMPAMRMDILVWRTEPLTQSRTYAIVIGLIALVALAHASVSASLRRWPIARVAFDAAVVVGAGAAAFHASPFLGRVFLLGIVPMAALFAPFVLPTEEARARSTLDVPVAVGLALQSVPLAWGVWTTTFDLPIGAIVGAQLGAWCFSAWRATKRGRKDEEALAGLPFTLFPIVGLLRAPGIGWIALVLASYVFLRLAIRAGTRLTALLRHAPQRVADAVVVASFWGTSAIVTLPYRFRDLPRLNHNSHETGAYATVNSILHGKLMMADAGLIYGPLRSYALTLYVLFAGVTAEQVRLGQALMNHAVLGILLALGWRLVDRRITAMVWYAYLLLVGTLVLLWENYAGYGMNAFGWADVGRIGLPFLATIGGINALVASTRGAPNLAGEELVVLPDRRSALELAGWGALAALATLWAQEFGVCAILALGAAPLVHFLLARGPLLRRARVAGASIGLLLAGTAATFGLYLGIYAVFGRARLFLKTVTDQSGAFASGSYGCFQFPATEGSFLSWGALTAPAPHQGGTSLEFIAPVAIYLVALVGLAARALSSNWRARDTMTLGLTLFGLASFRFALGRSDFIHLVTATLPAVALLPRLVVEGMRAVYAARPATTILRAAAAITALALALGSLNLAGIGLGLGPRLTLIFSGYERPSSGPAYSYPTIPRAGDTKIQPEYVALVEAIRANSGPKDKIFQHIGYMDGGEVYFLADRSNAIRYDILAEFLTTDRQVIAAEEIAKDPPKLVVGDDWGITGDGLNQFLKENYHSIGKFGGWDLLTRNSRERQLPNSAP